MHGLTKEIRTLPHVRIAADWWTEQLRKGVPKDNGDPFTSSVANFLCPPISLSEIQLAGFRDQLILSIVDHLQSLSDTWKQDAPRFGSYLRGFGCDYHPDLVLRQAADLAEVPERAFPWKTHMWIDPDGVRVKRGYGAPIETVWLADG
ncbi:MAG TPA: hypothetical protein VMY35_15120, partial [Phycisphaerae bacterium]|nr:hypothetical protein [Phycisphaerae bacterium]